MIKAVIFDLGGVVLDHTKGITLETLARTFNVETTQILEPFKTLDHDWVTGKLNEKEVIDKFRKIFSSKESTSEILSRYEKIYEAETNVNLDVLKIIDTLRKKYKVYLLTDTTDLHHRLNSKRNLFNHFDKVFASFLEGKRKKEKDFFEYTLKQIGLKPDECIFIDDRESNIQIAESVGIYGILFKNHQDLNKRLKELIFARF